MLDGKGCAGGMYLICYDMTSNRKRRKAAEILLDYGRRVQYSVFECEISRKQFEVLYAKLADLSEGMDDGNIRIYQIAKEEMQKIAILGNPLCIREDDLDDVVVI